MPIFIDTTGLYGNTAKTLPAPLPAGITLGGTGILQAGDGTAVAPTFSFANSTGLGLFRKAADSLGIAAAGVEVGSFTSAGAWTLGSSAGSAQTHTFQSGGTTTTALITGTSTDMDAVFHARSRGTYGAYFRGTIGTDTGTAPALKFDASINNTVGINVRPLFGWTNFGSSVGRITNTGAWELGPLNTSNAHIFYGVSHTLIGATGAPAYFRTNQADNNSGKTWRFGHTGGVGGFTTFDILNETDNVTALTISNTGVIFLGATSTTGQHLIRGGANTTDPVTGTPLIMQNPVAAINWRVGPDNGVGASRFYITNPSGTGAYITTGGTSWTATSDSRMKKNIQNLNYGLAEILAVSPKRFDYLTDESEASSRIGFIAQDLLPHLPEVVDASNPNQYGVSPTELIPVLVKAIQEQQTIIENLKSRLEILESN